jgi:hypothetical protein
MKEFIKDLKTFSKKHWKSILIVIGALLLLKYYPDIKSGFIDGWLNK